MTRPIHDERRAAPAVREWSRIRRRERERTEVARVLYRQGLNRIELAEILGVHWAQVDDVLAGRWGT